jgi:predicted RNA-binding protein with RPS1 domain
MLTKVMTKAIAVKIEELKTESDVEQKLVYPLLITPRPYGLGIDSPNIRTKPNIKSFEIEKRQNKKRYYPDYVVVISGFPLLVIEVKRPSEDLEEAYREARLYSSEINSFFPHKINPTTRLICTNGTNLIAGFTDAEPKYKLSLNELDPINSTFFDFVDDFKFEKLQELANQLHLEFRADQYYQPVKMLGGQAVRNEEVGTNSFGNIIALDYQHLFNPTTTEERAYIVQEAYITSKSRERYLQPIDRIVRAAIPPSEIDSEIVYSDEPKAIIKKLQNKNTNDLEHKILLLIGGVVSGKSTFVDYLRYEALPQEIIKVTTWIRVDMNEAPLELSMIYDWICDQMISEFRKNHSEIDFDELDNLMKLYSVEVNKFQKWAKLLEQNEYNSELYKEIRKLQSDKKQTVQAYLRYLCAERGRLGVLVLDNCDKRIRDEQLLMFQAAQWIQHEFRCLIFLPLRDITYNNHRHEPPLDTALKDLVFRIEPPGFQEVLVARIKLALKEMQEKSNQKVLEYQLPNKMRVTFPAEKLAYFLTSILKSLFEHDKYLRWMIVGLAGRDLRRAMEIFLDFCKSGHITESEITKICQAGGNYPIPFHIVSRVLMRMNRRFYNSDNSYVKNVFYSNPDDPKPFHFSRLAILKWLHSKHKKKGPINQPGYHKVSDLKSDLFLIALNDEAVHRELLYLLKAKCIIAEHLRVDQLDNDDLISLAPAGFVHIDLIHTKDYFSAVSEDTYFSDFEVAKSISERISDRKRQYSLDFTVANYYSLVDYLQSKIQDDILSPNSFLECIDWKTLISVELQDPWLGIEKRIHKDSVLLGTVTNIKDFGVFVRLEDNLDGLINKNDLGDLQFNDFRVNNKIEVRVLHVDKIRKRIRLVVENLEGCLTTEDSVLSLPKSSTKNAKKRSKKTRDKLVKSEVTQLEINLWSQSPIEDELILNQ